jgi:myo-inositol-1(or 4)-monophosphatase
MYQEFLTDVLEQASQIARNNFGKVAGITKPDDNNQVLTQTDIEIGKFLIEKISAAYPSHNIIDEEAGVIKKESEYTWVIDPVDGTSNFAQGIPHYGIIIGLLEHGNPVAGGIALPAFNEIIVAEKGNGAFCNGEKLHVTQEKDLLSALVAYGIDGNQANPDLTREECSLFAEIVLSIRNVRSSGSVFDGVMVAKGKYGAWLFQTSKIWDNVGVQIVIEEAGGVYTDFFGKTPDYSDALENPQKNYTWCAAPQALHEQLQEIIHKS